MEIIIVNFIHNHVEILKYLSILVGILYSMYRRIVSDRRGDDLGEQRTKYVKRLAEKVIMLEQHDEQSKVSQTKVNEEVKNELLRANSELMKHVHDLRDTIEELERRLGEIESPEEGLQPTTKKEPYHK